MPFPPSSNKKQNFLRALAGDKAKGMMPSQALAAPMAGGMNPPMATSHANPIMSPVMHTNPVTAPHIPQPAAPKLMPTTPSAMPVGSNIPALGAAPKMPKFNKMRNSLKVGPFKKQ